MGLLSDNLPAARPVVLIVDDEEEHRKLLSYLLRKEYDIRTAASGADALELMKSQRVDLALVDYRMPGLTGPQFFAELDKQQSDCVRFLVTAYGENDILQEAINVGHVYRFVQKPVDPDFLRLDIRRALEHRAASQELEKSAKLVAVGRLAGSVVHDLRNCLQVVAIVPDLLVIEGASASGETTAMLKRAERAMSDLIAELLVLAKGDTPRYELTPQALDDIVREAVNTSQKLPLFADRVVTTHIETPLPQVNLSHSRCMRMITNLLRNAAQATHAGDHITVNLRRTDRTLVLEVADTGPGIPDSVMANLFQPLFTTKGDAGVGLGLWICRSVMQAHHGTLECRSVVGQGTTFIATFPLA